RVRRRSALTTHRRIGRRAFGHILALAAVVGCRRVERGPTCGMKIDSASPWRPDLVTHDGRRIVFASPRCALKAWKSGRVPARSIRAQEYYERAFRDGAELRFVIGGDVNGPMGPDFVPVDPTRVGKFLQDHGAARALTVAEIAPEM